MSDIIEQWKNSRRQTFRTDTKEGGIASELNRMAATMVDEIERLRADLTRQIAITTELANENERLRAENEELHKPLCCPIGGKRMTNTNEELASRIQHAPNHPVVQSLLFQACVSFGLRDTLKNAKLVQKALRGDVTSALAIKDALFPGMPMNLKYNGICWQAALCDHGAIADLCGGVVYAEGASKQLSHAIMAALVRASGKGGGMKWNTEH